MPLVNSKNSIETLQNTHTNCNRIDYSIGVTGKATIWQKEEGRSIASARTTYVTYDAGSNWRRGVSWTIAINCSLETWSKIYSFACHIKIYGFLKLRWIYSNYSSLSPTHPGMIPPPGLPPMRGVGKFIRRKNILPRGELSLSLSDDEYKKTMLMIHCVVGVAPAGARVPLRGPMTRGDYGELSMIQFYIDQFPYCKTFSKSRRKSNLAL